MSASSGGGGGPPVGPSPGQRLCDVCGKAAEPGKKLQRCSHCLSALYCSSACQRAAWSAHKGPCKLTSKFDVYDSSPLLAAVAFLPRLFTDSKWTSYAAERVERRGRELHLHLAGPGPQRPPAQFVPGWEAHEPSREQMHMMAWHIGYAEATTVGALYGFHCAVQRYNGRGSERVVLTCQDSKLVEYGIVVGPHNPDYVMVFHKGGQATQPQDPVNHVQMYFRTDRYDQVHLDVAALSYGMGMMLNVVHFLPERGTPEARLRSCHFLAAPAAVMNKAEMVHHARGLAVAAARGATGPDGWARVPDDHGRVPVSGLPALAPGSDPRPQLRALLQRVRGAGVAPAGAAAAGGSSGGGGGGRGAAGSGGGGAGGGRHFVPFRDGPLDEHVEWAVKVYECALRNTRAVLEQGTYKLYPAELNLFRCFAPWVRMAGGRRPANSLEYGQWMGGAMGAGAGAGADGYEDVD